MTKQEREYLVLWLALDLARLLRAEHSQQVAYVALVTETLAAIEAWMNRRLLSKQERQRCPGATEE